MGTLTALLLESGSGRDMVDGMNCPMIRAASAGLAAMVLLLAAGCSTSGPASHSSQTRLAPGQFEWHPERSPKGPLLVVVSIDDQMAYVYRNGVQIARSTVSTGRPGKETPTGVFTVLQRKTQHESSIYKGSQMPYMQRLTWGGIALHAGQLPGYPASAGCVRLPYAFSEKLYGIMQNGSTVVITRRGTSPSSSKRPADILLASRTDRPGNRAIPDPAGRVVWQPQKSPSGPFSILVSYADRTAYVWRNGIQIGQSPITLAPGATPPEGVFVMLDGAASPDSRFPGMRTRPWSVLSLNGGGADRNAVEKMREQIRLPLEFRENVAALLTPGTILVATRETSNASTRSESDFAILRPDDRRQ